MIIDKMQNLNNFTFQEQVVVDHIIKYPKDLLEMSITELAEASYTSASTIIRLCKKLGPKGYADLKFIYASEYQKMMELKLTINIVYNRVKTRRNDNGNKKISRRIFMGRCYCC